MNTGFIYELGLPALIKIRENTWNGKNYIELEQMATTDTDIINYRLDALTDLMENDGLYASVNDILPELMTLYESRVQVTGGVNEETEGLYAVRDLQIYVKLVDYLSERLNSFELRSELFKKLRSGIADIVSEDSYKKIKENIPENARLITDMKSVTIGVNLDSGLHPTESGIVSINDRRFESGSIVDKLLRMDLSDNPYSCAAPLMSTQSLLTGRDERQNFEISLNSGLFKMVKSSVKSWKPAIKAYTSSKTSFISSFYGDLRFLSAAAEFFRRLQSMRYPVCRPKVMDMDKKSCTLKDAYFPELVLNGNPMVGNDITFDENGMIYLFSGANSGGKTIFAKTVAVCQALFQLGLYVPAEYAEISPADEILMHLPSSGKSIVQSRFTEECEKMSTLMKSAGEHTMIFCDEAFSGTSAFEASAIAGEVIKAMSAKGCRGIFITHIHELSALKEEINGSSVCRSRLDNLTVLIDKKDGRRLFKVSRQKTSGTSHAADIAARYGLSFDELMNNRSN